MEGTHWGWRAPPPLSVYFVLVQYKHEACSYILNPFPCPARCSFPTPCIPVEKGLGKISVNSHSISSVQTNMCYFYLQYIRFDLFWPPFNVYLLFWYLLRSCQFSDILTSLSLFFKLARANFSTIFKVSPCNFNHSLSKYKQSIVTVIWQLGQVFNALYIKLD